MSLDTSHPLDAPYRKTPEMEEFVPENLATLSERDTDLILSWLDNPPEPNEALKAAWKKYGGNHA